MILKKISKGKEEIIERDGMAKEYAEYEQGNIESLKDLAIFLLKKLLIKIKLLLLTTIIQLFEKI